MLLNANNPNHAITPCASVFTTLRLIDKHGSQQSLTPIVPRVYKRGAFSSVCLDTDIKFRDAKKVTSITKVLHNVNYWSLKVENTSGGKK